MTRDSLPDMEFMRKTIPITEVADKLGIRRAGTSLAHCWREGHQHGDRSPSMSFHKNRAKCHVCDAAPLSTIDLVMKHQECSLSAAASWLCGNFSVPMIGKNKKLVRPERWASVPVGLAYFPLENLVRAGQWAAFEDADRAVLIAILCFIDPVKHTAEISHRALCRYSGRKSRTTIAKVLKHFKNIGLIEVSEARGCEGFRQVSTYKLTMDSETFQGRLSECHQRFKGERDLARNLQAEIRANALAHTPAPSPKPQIPKSNTMNTVVDTLSSERHSPVDRGLEHSRRKPSQPALSGDDSKATSESARFTQVDNPESWDYMAALGVA
jgi:hypothetical protein